MEMATEADILHLQLTILAGAGLGDQLWRPLPASLPAILFGSRLVPSVTQVHSLLAEASPAALHKASAMLAELLEIAAPLKQKIGPGRVREQFLAYCAARAYGRVLAHFQS